MSNEETQFRVRIPADMHAELTRLAEKNQRSINAEITARLRSSLRWDAHDPDEVARFLHNLDTRIDKAEAEISRVLGHIGLDEMPKLSLFHYSEAAPSKEPQGKSAAKKK